jgi:hypothetical protein
MIDSDKKAFKEMINAVFSIYGKPLPEQEMLRIWWHKLERFEFGVVGRAFDKWTDTPNKLPQPADIVQLCKPRESEYHALPAPVSYAENKENVDKLNRFIAEKLKPKTDFHQWAKRILATPQNFPEGSIEAAKSLLGDNYGLA